MYPYVKLAFCLCNSLKIMVILVSVIVVLPIDSDSDTFTLPDYLDAMPLFLTLLFWWSVCDIDNALWTPDA